MLRRSTIDCSPDHSLRGVEYALWLRDPLTLYGASNAQPIMHDSLPRAVEHPCDDVRHDAARIGHVRSSEEDRGAVRLRRPLRHRAEEAIFGEEGTPLQRTIGAGVVHAAAHDIDLGARVPGHRRHPAATGHAVVLGKRRDDAAGGCQTCSAQVRNAAAAGEVDEAHT